MNFTPALKVIASAALAMTLSSAIAAGKSQTGAFNGLEWTAKSMLTGITNTQSGGPSPTVAIRSIGSPFRILVALCK